MFKKRERNGLNDKIFIPSFAKIGYLLQIVSAHKQKTDVTAIS
jgi:hypothetical protein